MANIIIGWTLITLALLLTIWGTLDAQRRSGRVLAAFMSLSIVGVVLLPFGTMIPVPAPFDLAPFVGLALAIISLIAAWWNRDQKPVEV